MERPDDLQRDQERPFEQPPVGLDRFVIDPIRNEMIVVEVDAGPPGLPAA